MIIVDDGSSDNSKAVLEDCLKTDSRIRGISQPNGGPAKARNTGLAMATGEYIIFIDIDDKIEPNMLERMYDTAKTAGADIVVCGFDRIDSNTGKVISKEMCNTDSSIAADNGTVPFINTSLWNKLIRRECIGDLKLPDIRICEDGLFFLQLIPHVDKVISLPEVLYHYMVYDNTVISSLTPGEYEKIKDAFLTAGRNMVSLKKDQMILAAFIHLVISLLYRLSYNKNADIKSEIRKTKDFFNENYPGYYKTTYMKLAFLRKRGVRGLAIWMTILLFRMNLIKIYLWQYRFMIDRLKINIKW
jgi:glycosyltransferase involved in cell wall biosynthesis